MVSLHASRDKSSAIQYILSHSVICALRTLRFCSFWLNRLELLILCHRWPTMFASAELKWVPIVKWAGLRHSLGWNRDPRKRARSSSNFGGFIYIFVRGLVGRRVVIKIIRTYEGDDQAQRLSARCVQYDMPWTPSIEDRRDACHISDILTPIVPPGWIPLLPTYITRKELVAFFWDN